MFSVLFECDLAVSIILYPFFFSFIQVRTPATMLLLWQRRTLDLASEISGGRNHVTLVWGNLQAGTFP